MAKKDNKIIAWIDKYRVLFVLGIIILFMLILWLFGGTKSNTDTVTPTEKTAGTSQAQESEAATLTEPAKPQEWGDGTYEVGRDIPAGTYVANGTDCYWQISRDSNGTDIIENNVGNGQQIVTLTDGTYFKVSRCPFIARK